MREPPSQKVDWDLDVTVAGGLGIGVRGPGSGGCITDGLWKAGLAGATAGGAAIRVVRIGPAVRVVLSVLSGAGWLGPGTALGAGPSARLM